MAKYQLFNNMNSPQPLSASQLPFIHIFFGGYGYVDKLV